MEVDAVDGVGGDGQRLGRRRREVSHRRVQFAGQPDVGREVELHLRRQAGLAQFAPRVQRGTDDQTIGRRLGKAAQVERLGFHAVELERGVELLVEDGRHPIAGGQRQRQLPERLRAHDAGQQRRAVHGVVV